MRLSLVLSFRLIRLALLLRLLHHCATEELRLLLAGLEAPMSELRGSVDELELDLLHSLAAHLRQERLPQRHDALARARHRALEHQPVLRHLAIMGEATHRRDPLLREVGLCHRAVRVVLGCLADPVDLLVDLGAVAVSLLTRPGHLELDTRRVPRADASNLPEPTVGLARKAGDTPAGDDTLGAGPCGNRDAIDHLVLVENVRHLDLLLEHVHNEIYLFLGGATVHLDLLDVGLLLPKLHLRDLCVADRADDLAVLLRPGDFGGHRGALGALARIAPPLLVLGKGLLLRLVPGLVEAPLALLAQVPSPDRSQGPEAAWCLHVADKADDDHRRRLDDGHGLSDLLLVELRPGPVHLTDDVGHTRLIRHEGSEMGRLRCIVLREALDLSGVVLRALPGQEAQGAVTGTLELPMRHGSG
mmetsp:Transcript_20315/g.41723  ORF Transcript_20315/g.41723 Transcript_20315/m.41723 type:complete len:417 (+) Transcript_20315:26-1276(+)